MTRTRKSTAGRALAEQVQEGQEGKREDGVLFEEVEGTVPFGQDLVYVIGPQVRDTEVLTSDVWMASTPGVAGRLAAVDIAYSCRYIDFELGRSFRFHSDLSTTVISALVLDGPNIQLAHLLLTRQSAS